MTKTNVPRLRFKEFDGEWTEKSLGDVSKIGDGLHGTPKYSGNGDFAFINGNNLKNNRIYISNSNKYVKESELTSIDNNLNEKSMLISLNGTIGNVAIYNNEKIKLSKSTGYINFHNLNRMFMLYQLSTNSYKTFFQKNVTGTTIKNLSLLTLKNTNIRVTSSLEQQKVGSFFAKIDKLIELQRKKLEQLKKLKRGYLQKMFPQDGESIPRLRFSGFSGEWKEYKLGHVYTVNTGKSVYNSSNYGKYPIAGSTGIIGYDNEFDYEGNFLLIARVGDAGSTYYNSGKMKITDNTIFIDAEYENFLSGVLKNKNIKRFSVGSGRKLIKSSDLKKINVALPEKSEQLKIDIFLNELNRMIEAQDKKISTLKQQKKSYLQKMFI